MYSRSSWPLEAPPYGDVGLFGGCFGGRRNGRGCPLLFLCGSKVGIEAKADEHTSFDLAHLVLCELANVVVHAELVNREDLLADCGGGQTRGFDVDVRGQRLLLLRSQVDDLQSSGILVVLVVADDDAGATAVLLTANLTAFRQDIVNFSAIKHTIHSSVLISIQCKM